MTDIPQIGVAFVKLRENLETVAYPDPATKGPPWTVGYGHTGPEVVQGYTVDEPTANEMLIFDLHTALMRLEHCVGSVDAMNAYQLSALLSFVFNEGANPSWSIWDPVKRGAWAEVPAHLEQFIYANHVINNGLINRRNDEVALWNGKHPLCAQYPLEG